MNSGFGFSEDLEKHMNVLELESGCLEDESIEVLESIPSKVTFLSKAELKEDQNQLSYKLKTKEGPVASLTLSNMKSNGTKTLARLIIGDIGPKLRGGRLI